MTAVVVGLENPHVRVRSGLVDAVAVGTLLCIAHELVELAHAERATLTTGKHLRLEQESAVNVHHNLRRALEIDIQQGQPLVTLQA